jgi:asparagine synthase (glutamine-hydrolysing)
MRPEDRVLIEQIRACKLTYLSNSKLEALISAARRITEFGVPGAFVEAGCALGGSTILIAKLKENTRPLRVYDVFSTIPAPTAADETDAQKRYADIQQLKSKGIGGNKYYGYEENLYEMVAANLTRFGIDRKTQHVELIRGLLQETMVIDGPIAFAHIDVDWYEPVKISLERIVPHLSVGGALIVDDYQDWGGCRRATDEYFSGIRDEFGMDSSAGSMNVTRLRPMRSGPLTGVAQSQVER